MPLKSETLPNRALTGSELKEILEKNLSAMLKNDYAFMHTVAYRRVAVKIEVTLHLGSPHGVHTVKSYTKSAGMVTGEPPLPEVCECGHGKESHGDMGCHDEIGVDETCPCASYKPEETAVVALERTVNLDNPNLVRVHNDMPIYVDRRRDPETLPHQPLPGEPPPENVINPFPKVDRLEVRYDAKDFPPTEAPVDRDVSEEKAAELGVKPRKALGLRDRKNA